MWAFFSKINWFSHILFECVYMHACNFSHWHLCQLILVITLWMSSGNYPSRRKAWCNLVVQQNDLKRATGKVCIERKCLMSSLILSASSYYLANWKWLPEMISDATKRGIKSFPFLILSSESLKKHFFIEQHCSYIQSHRLQKVQTVTDILKHLTLISVFLSA